MAFTTTEKAKVLKHLNLALIRSWQYRVQWGGYEGDFYRYDAVLTPTEYQASIPSPIKFTAAQINDRLALLEGEHGEDEVREIITALDAVATSLSSERVSTNRHLKKADTLEWEITGVDKLSGYTEQRSDLIEQLRYWLNLPPQNLGYGQATVSRG